MALTNLHVFPVGNKRMSISEYTGATGATLDIGLTRIDGVSVLSRGGNTDTLLDVTTASGSITLAGLNASGKYLIQAIGL